MAHLHLSYYPVEVNEGSALLDKYNPISHYDCPAAAPHNRSYICPNGSLIEAAPTYCSIVSCSLSILGSLLIFVAFFTLKGIRNVAQKIITLLALADFFTATGYLMADWNFLANSKGMEHCNRFSTVCEIQSFVTSWSSICSFGWTCALALHFYLILSSTRKRFLASLVVWENLVIWAFPLLIVVPLLVTKRLGYSPYATSNWCFIRNLVKSNYKNGAEDGLDKEEIALILIGGKLWEILSYFFVVVTYTMTYWKFRKRVRVFKMMRNYIALETAFLSSIERLSSSGMSYCYGKGVQKYVLH